MLKDGLEIPDHLGSEVTFDQKKRLARLAKMGIGPVAKQPSRPSQAVVAAEEARESHEERERRLRMQMQERRASMLNHERRIRAQQELKRQEEEKETQELEDQKRRKSRAGLQSLGAVQPREAKTSPARPAAFPVPASISGAVFEEPSSSSTASASIAAASPAASSSATKMEVKISSETVERVGGASSSIAAAGEGASLGAARRFREGTAEEDAGALSAEAQVLAALRAKKSPQASELEEERRRRKKRRKKVARRETEKDEPETDDSYEEEEVRHRERLNAHALKQARDGGISWKIMNVESVKGKVSNDNKHMTDADLERRFGSTRDSDPSTSGMMTEEQVLALMQKERKGQRDTAAASRRAKRELAEWTQLKAQRMARTGPDEKERLVVSRR